LGEVRRFLKEMERTPANTAELAKIAKTGGVPAVQAQCVSALNLQGCHDTYREQKNNFR